MIPKQERIKDESYLNFVRSLPCGVCLGPSADAHHLQTVGAGGSDYTAVPMCRGHHTAFHSLGFTKFQQSYGVNLWKLNAYTLSKYVQKLMQQLADSVTTHDPGWGE